MSFLDEKQILALATPIVLQHTHASAVTDVLRLAGGASLRRYYRISGVTGDGIATTVIVMETGEPGHSDEVTSGATPTEMPFINIQRYLWAGGVPVPEIYHHDVGNGLLYIEDLGDITFESRVVHADDQTRADYYRRAIDVLVGMQSMVPNAAESCVAFSRSFDAKLLAWELDHFREYGLDARGMALGAADRDAFDRVSRRIADEIAGWPQQLVHRDYQSRNLMVQDGAEGPRLRVIDFQDALMGSDAYDLVGLLRDSYVALSPSLIDELVAYYAKASGQDLTAFSRRFYLQTVQRKLKDAGRFVFIEEVKKLPGFVQHIPRTLGYVSHALDKLAGHPDAVELRSILRAVLPNL